MSKYIPVFIIDIKLNKRKENKSREKTIWVKFQKARDLYQHVYTKIGITV